MNIAKEVRDFEMMKMEKLDDIDEKVIEKATQVAFCSLRELHTTPFVKPDGRVAFKVRGDVTGALAELASNPLVPLLDFLNRLDAVC